MKKSVATCCILLICSFLSNASWAEEWPKERPIRIIVPQAAGGTNDIVTRLISLELSKSLGQSIIIENKPGASGAIGMQTAASATPDGYTFAIASDSIAILSATKESLSWKLGRDLIGVSLLGEQPIGIAVSSQTSFQTLQDLINAAKNKPDTELVKLREAELKHGRWGMISALAIPVTESITHNQAIHILDDANVHTIAGFTGVVAAAEFRSMLLGWENPFANSSNYFLMKSDYQPGDLGLKASFVGNEKPFMFDAEINNGRLAMIGSLGMIAQELVTNKPIF